MTFNHLYDDRSPIVRTLPRPFEINAVVALSETVWATCPELAEDCFQEMADVLRAAFPSVELRSLTIDEA